jgi:hypothetical protein
MSIDHSAREVLESATTRRRIVTTGAKAAYAAPVIAATMTLGGGHAGAVSGPQTTRHCSPPMQFGPMGWGGWSCPAGSTAVDGEVLPAGAQVTSQQVAPAGSTWPHYTFGAAETGYVVQNINMGQELTVCVDCA